MTKEREILNDKLNSIDYGLNEEKLWASLEQKLPPEKRNRKFAFLWLWSGLATLLMVAGYFYMQDDVKVSHDIISIESDKQNVLAAANKEEKKEVSLSYNKTETSHEVPAKSVKTSVTTKSLNSRKSNTDRHGVTVGNVVITDTSNDQNSSPNYDQDNNKTADAAITIKNTSIITEDGVLVTDNYANTNFEILDSAFSDKFDNPKMSSAHNTQSKSAPILQSREEIYFPFIPTIQSPTLSPSKGEINTPMAHAIIPVKESKGLEFSLAATYGYRLGDASMANTDSTSVSYVSEEAVNSYVDVAGIDVGLGIPLYKGLIANAGVSLNRFTDKSTILTKPTQSIESFGDGGFTITDSQYELTLYNQTDVVDLSLGLGYTMDYGKWSIRPSIGINYNLYNNINSKSTSGINFDQELIEVDRSTVKLDKFNRSVDLGLGYQGSITAGYAFSPSVEAFAGVKYQGNRSSTEKFQISNSLQSTAGLRYRF